MELSQNNEPVTPTAIRDKFMGKVEKKNDTLLSLFAEFIERQRPLVGIDITRSTFNKYDLTYRRLEEFLFTKQKKKDIPIQDIDDEFVRNFHIFLKVDKRLSINSSEKLMYLGYLEVGRFLVHDFSGLADLCFIHSCSVAGVIEVGDVCLQQEHRTFRGVVGQRQVLQGRVGGGHALGEGLQSQCPPPFGQITDRESGHGLFRFRECLSQLGRIAV